MQYFYDFFVFPLDVTFDRAFFWKWNIFFCLGKKLQHNPHKGWQGLKNVIFKEINTQAMKRNVRALNTNMRQYF